ncbi:MAG: DHHA1 domain-containing protein, partial [Dehalococcoidia bacterium]|nr:DHHA1 domain-containing protein [Dehalococcoidia bacterium]
SAGLTGTTATVFDGYDSLSTEATVVALRHDGAGLQTAGEGSEVDIILDRSPFYGDMGGQVGDLGRLSSVKVEVAVRSTVRTGADITVHRGHVVRGKISVGDTVRAEVEEGRRLDIARNHTATHLLQAGLRAILGRQVAQRGSLVEPERFRFDFSWMGPVERERIVQVEQWVNEKIRADLPVVTRLASYNEAVAEGAIALFDEKYGDRVRVVSVGQPAVSTELCGGTHVRSTGQIGMLLIVTEGSVGTGLRRVEAVTGRGAEALVRTRTQTLESVAAQLGATPADVLDRLTGTLGEFEAARKRLGILERQLSAASVASLASQAVTISGVPVVATRVQDLSVAALRDAGDTLRERLGDSVVVFATVENERPIFLVMVSQALTSRGVHAGEIAKRAARVTGGGGGGKPTMAQAGGKDTSKIDEALGEAKRAIEEQLATGKGG